MIPDIIRGKFVRSGNSRLCIAGFLLCVMTATGCARILSVEYQPTNQLRGQGSVTIAPFRYQPSDEQRVRPRQVETNPSAKTELFFVHEISAFFSDALGLELRRSGYGLTESSDRIVSGTLTRFYLDWTSGGDRSFELAADYTVQSAGHTVFSWHCTSVQKGPNILVEDGMLIRTGTADCMSRFIHAAQVAKVF
ncbi:hypothetical protein [Nitrospira lenta]|uniref:Putative lipoprotein n=1 Tax=Nitrospira lenta TaxID=1436998 RepID=A0A330LCU5_9BACT|nr:hypothetical protein [Nitrospira lenta]SPP66873.1 putative lipoprotein [Nitrospira lenta]